MIIKPVIKKIALLQIAGFVLLASSTSQAQIVPDVTLPINSSAITQGNTTNITGGTKAGSNLFHSFKQFSLPTGGVAYFNNALNIQNVIARVTGSSISNIDGLIQSNGTANLFLLNPNGLFFGRNARLNIGGSFVGSTANNLKFADGSQFSATASQALPLLTITVPIGLQFQNSPGNILVQGDGQGARQTSKLIDTTTGLRVQPNQTLALLGGNVALEGATLKTAGGRIELGSVAGSGLVNLNPSKKGFSFSYEKVPTFANILLSQQATIDASGAGGGDIQIQGSQLKLADGSQIEASTLRSEPGGTLSIFTSNSVELTGNSPDGLLASSIVSEVYPGATGSGDNLILKTKQLIAQGGGDIGTSTLSKAAAGLVSISASDSVELSGFLPNNPDAISFPSGVFATVSQGATGLGGNLNLETRRLILQNGAQIYSGTFGKGPGGSLTVLAHDSVEVIGTSAANLLNTALSTVVQPGATGAGGNLTLQTQRLIIRDGGLISSATYGVTKGGNLFIKAGKSIDLSGLPTEIFPSGLSARSKGTGDAGDLNVETGQLTVHNGAQITVNNDAIGNAGNLKISANSINLNQANIIASTQRGQGGNISLNSKDLLLLRRGSQVSATAGTAQAGGNGGNININTPLLFAVPSENSDISANAYTGNGGNINITAQGIFGIQPRNQDTPLSDITASSRFGINGTVRINAVDIPPLEVLDPFQTNPIDLAKLIANGCAATVGPHGNKFTITGTDGLPPNTSNDQGGDKVWADISSKPPSTFVSSAQSLDQSSIAPVPSTEIEYHGGPIIEAQAMVRGKNGEVIFTSAAPALTPDIPWLHHPTCDLH